MTKVRQGINHRRGNVAALLWAFAAIILWSTNASVANYALAHLHVTQVQFLQYFGAFIVFYIVSRADLNSNKSVIFNKYTVILSSLGLVGTMFFQYLAFQAGPIMEANIVAYSWPLLSAMMFIFANRINNPVLFVMIALFGYLGIYIIFGNLKDSGNIHGEYVLSFFYAFMSALCMAIYSYFSKLYGNLSTRNLLIASVIGMVFMTPWLVSSKMQIDDPAALLLALYLGIAPMGLGYLFWTRALRLDQTGSVVFLGFLTPVISTLGLAVTGEPVAWNTIVGGSMVVVSCIIVSLKNWSRE